VNFVVESCVYYGCVPWDGSPHPRAGRLVKTGLPLHARVLCPVFARARDRVTRLSSLT
jgi:hypothetical protein